MAHAVQFIMRRFQIFVWNQDDVGFRARFEDVNFSTLFIQQERGHIDRDLHIECGSVFFHRFFLDDAQDM